MKELKISKEWLKKTIEIEHVTSVFVATYDGYFIDGLSQNPIDSNTIAEMTANECSSLLRLTSALKLGDIKQVILDCERGKLTITISGGFILGIVTGPGLILGMIRCMIEPILKELIIES